MSSAVCDAPITLMSFAAASKKVWPVVKIKSLVVERNDVLNWFNIMSN